MSMTDEAYVAACESLGTLKDSPMSKSMATVIAETRRRTLESLAVEVDPGNMIRLQARAQQLASVLLVLHGDSTTMTI